MISFGILPSASLGVSPACGVVPLINPNLLFMTGTISLFLCQFSSVLFSIWTPMNLFWRWRFVVCQPIRTANAQPHVVQILARVLGLTLLADQSGGQFCDSPDFIS